MPQLVINYPLSDDYKQLVTLMKEQSIICLVRYADCIVPSDVARTAYDQTSRGEQFEIRSRGHGYISGLTEEEFIEECQRGGVLFVTPFFPLAAPVQLCAPLHQDDAGGCKFAGPGRGDCEHFIGYPSTIHKPGKHDGPDDTVDAWGKPNGWCWHCWLSFQLGQAREKLRAQAVTVEFESREDFVAILDGRPWRVAMNEAGDFWMYYWHADKKWVSSAKLDKVQTDKFYALRLPLETARLYEAGVPFKVETISGLRQQQTHALSTAAKEVRQSEDAPDTNSEEWKRFVDVFKDVEGFDPHPRDRRARSLFGYFYSGVLAAKLDNLP